MRLSKLAAGAMLLCGVAAITPVAAQAPPAGQQRPNIIMIMGDDVGTWNISAFHRGMMGGNTPNLDRIAREGALFTDSTHSNPAPQGARRSSSGSRHSAQDF